MGFEKAMDGCKYVIHVSSPCARTVDDPQKDLIDPAVKGTEAVMQAAKKMGIVRIVLTSDIGAIGPPITWINDSKLADNEKVFSEEDWNKDATMPYFHSKWLAEEKAWEVVSDAEGMSLVTICPAFMIGPMLGNRADDESVAFIKTMLDGTMKDKGCIFCSPVVDVRDVSLAHVTAMESAEAGGKRIMMTSEKAYKGIELVDMLKDRFKAYNLPAEGSKTEYVPKFDPTRAKDLLKFAPRPVEISMRDMASAAIRHGIVERKFLLKSVKFWQVAKVNPDSKGVDLLVKVVSVKEPEATAKGNGNTQEIQVGDVTGVITLWLVGDEIGRVSVDDIVEVRNATVKMIKGFIRLQIGKWGKLMKHEGEVQIIPNSETNVSATEYELVAA